MLTAAELNPRPQPRQWFRPEVVKLVSLPMEEAEPEPEPPKLPKRPACEATERLVRELCHEIRRGITCSLVTRLVGCNAKHASTYLARLRQRGYLEVVGLARTNGRPAKIYRVKD